MNEIHTEMNVLGRDIINHYKYWIYLKINPRLVTSPFLNRIDNIGKKITKFRVGSHNLKIESGRWSRVSRSDQLCTTCNELGDEYHAVYRCHLIHRDELLDIPHELSSIWNYYKINDLFERFRSAGLIK